ncbi:MAG: PIN domain-containing protein [Bauldia sp.]
MIGLDTNILVRLITGDDPAQAARAAAFLTAHCSSSEPAFISCVVLAELEWVLAGSYGYGVEEIATAIDGIVKAADQSVEHEPAVRAALSKYRAGGVDFADALIGAINSARGCNETVTFDRRAARKNGFRLLR